MAKAFSRILELCFVIQLVQLPDKGQEQREQFNMHET